MSGCGMTSRELAESALVALCDAPDDDAGAREVVVQRLDAVIDAITHAQLDLAGPIWPHPRSSTTAAPCERRGAA